jgi:hypothetical protein
MFNITLLCGVLEQEESEKYHPFRWVV